MRIFILKTNLFTENNALDQVIAQFEAEHQLEIFDTTRSKLDDDDWDDALEQLLLADKVLTI